MNNDGRRVVADETIPRAFRHGAGATVATPWRTMTEAGQRVGGRGKRFMRGQVNVGKLKAAKIGGRSEYFTCDEWIDEWVEAQLVQVPVLLPRRRTA